ncbi:MAG: polymerase sigma factor SigY [Candidatus Eremiobacteraeota bacterium]|nr:polymerase sigma factor SigY [Candidatus Eremiobacteraeota bacterium]
MLALKTVDQGLVLKAAAGDAGSAEALLAEIWPAAYRSAVALCGGDAATAQDAVQNACLSCLDGLPKLREPEKFIAWFMRILTRAARKELKRNARWRSASQSDCTQIFPGDESWSFLRTCVLELPKALREALILTTIVGYSSDEVAAILRVPAGTVRYRVHEARKRLNVLLDRSERDTNRRLAGILTDGASNG